MKLSLKIDSPFKKYLFALISVSALIRAALAWSLDLGANEAYYWTYGAYPDLSHLDHPPMIGWFIQLFSVNLSFGGEFFLRLASIITGSVNTWIIFVLGRRIKNELTGIYAALLYTASVYASVFIGTFINPDTPQSLFFLLSIYFLHEGLITKYESCEETRTLCKLALVIAGIFTGLAMLSKYSSIFLWLGVAVYALSSDRTILKKPFFYISVLISGLFLLPVILWNIENNFVSFAFQGSRLLSSEGGFNLESFIRSLAGIIIFNNPVNIFVIIAAVVAYRKRKFISLPQYRLLISLSLPMIIFFLAVSLFTESKPNWSAPGFFPLILVASAYLASKYEQRDFRKLIMPAPVANAFSFLFILTALGVVHYYTGFLNIDTKRTPGEKIGREDFTLDYFGWRTLAHDFSELRQNDLDKGLMSEKTFILSTNWEDASHKDFYIASPAGTVVKTIGPLKGTRKYAWITGELGTFKIGESAYFILSSRDSTDVAALGKRYFRSVEKAGNIYIKKLGKPVLRFEVFRMKEMVRIPERELCSFTKY